jgi:Tol biopolymer transport system component
VKTSAPTHPYRLVLAALATAALLVFAQPGDAHAASRIVVRAGGKKLVAFAPGGHPAQTLVRLRRGTMLGTAAARDGTVVAYVSRTRHGIGRERVWTDRIWTLRPGGRPRVVDVARAGTANRAGLIDTLALSPDGGKLLFETNVNTVFLMRSGGGGLRQVRASRTFGRGGGRGSTGPQFTPDGRGIIAAFYPRRGRVDATGGIGTVSLSGGHVHLLARGPDSAGIGEFLGPTVSPDGSLIAYVLRRNSGDAIWTMRRNGLRAHRVARLPGWRLSHPSFSPSGRSLAFAGEHEEHKSYITVGKSAADVFAIRLGGGRPHPIERDRARLTARTPDWVGWPAG